MLHNLRTALDTPLSALRDAAYRAYDDDGAYSPRTVSWSVYGAPTPDAYAAARPTIRRTADTGPVCNSPHAPGTRHSVLALPYADDDAPYPRIRLLICPLSYGGGMFAHGPYTADDAAQLRPVFPETLSYLPLAITADCAILCQWCAADHANPVHTAPATTPATLRPYVDTSDDGWSIEGWAHSGDLDDDGETCDSCGRTL